jgi:hypothetical protein
MTKISTLGTITSTTAAVVDVQQTPPERLKTMTKQSAEQIEVKKWLAIRKRAGRKIDPETAEVTWAYRQVLDPYGIYPELPEECYCVGREYFARSPGSDIWVCFGDLPTATCDALWKKYQTYCATITHSAKPKTQGNHESTIRNHTETSA